MRHPALIPLSHDHHHGLALALRCRKQALGQLKPMGLKGLKERTQELRDFFANNLVAHFRAEEEVLLPKLRELMPESAAIVDQLVHEHRQLRDAVAQLDTDAGLSKLVFNFGDLLENKQQTGHQQTGQIFCCKLLAFVERSLTHCPRWNSFRRTLNDGRRLTVNKRFDPSLDPSPDPSPTPLHLEGATDSEGTYSRFKRIDGLLKQLQSGKIDHQKFAEEISGPSRDIRVQGSSLFLMHKGKRYLVTARHVVFDEVSAKREI